MEDAQIRVVELNKIKFHLLHHSENLYKCQYCDHIDFNRNEMKAHMRNIHRSLIMNAIESSIIVLRQTALDDIVDRSRNRNPGIFCINYCMNPGLKPLP